MEPDDKNLVFKPIEEVSESPGGLVEHLKNKWWCHDPERGLIFWHRTRSDSLSPQCNSTEAITKHLQSRLYPWAKIIFVPSVFVRIDPHDYV